MIYLPKDHLLNGRLQHSNISDGTVTWRWALASSAQICIPITRAFLLRSTDTHHHHVQCIDYGFSILLLLCGYSVPAVKANTVSNRSELWVLTSSNITTISFGS